MAMENTSDPTIIMTNNHAMRKKLYKSTEMDQFNLLGPNSKLIMRINIIKSFEGCFEVSYEWFLGASNWRTFIQSYSVVRKKFHLRSNIFNRLKPVEIMAI